MPDIRLNWSNRNSQRSYPLEESATKLSDSGERLPDNALVSIKVRFPSLLGARCAVGGVSISSGMATVTLVAVDGALTAASAVPIGVVSVTAPVIPGKSYQIQALYPGVSGWVGFGDLVLTADDVQSWRFGDPSEVPVIPSESRVYDELPVPYAGKYGLEAKLTGLVSLIGDGDIVIEGADRDVGNGTERVILMRLDSEHNAYVLRDYAGPCAGRPESGTCDFTPITQINSVMPDCDGNLDILFEDPFVVTADLDWPYLSVDFPVSLEEACDALKAMTRPSADGTIPGAWEDLCEEDPFF